MATLQQAIDNLVTATSTANDVINQAKTVNTNATNHKTDPAAHSELFAKPAPDVALSGGKTAKGQGQVGPCVRTASVTDADQYVTDGRYYVYTTEAVSNWPTEGTGGILHVNSYSTYVAQEMHLFNGKVCTRMKPATGAWSPWKTVITEDMANKANGYISLDASQRAVIGGENFSAGGSSAKLQVRDTGYIYLESTRDGGYPQIVFNTKKTGGSSSSNITQISFLAEDSSGQNLTAGAININAKTLFSSPEGGSSQMRFATKNTSDANAIYRYVIDSDGSILPYSSNSYDIGKTGQHIRNIYSANAVTVGSDRRLKTDIEDTPLGLDFINALRPVAYRLIVGDRTVTMEQETDENGEPLFVDVQDGTEQVRVGMDEHGEPIFEERPVIRREPKLRETVTTRPGARTHYGLIAQEVKETLDSVAPGVDFAGWVLEDKNDPDSQQALRYEQFIAPLIRAAQEQQVQIEALKAEVAALKAGV